MRILLHSNAPWVPSGYGRQCHLVAQILRDLGHDVVISAMSGLNGAPVEWDRFLVLPHGRMSYGVDMLIGHARLVQAELVLTLMDTYQLWPIAEQLRELNVASWMPIDTSTLGRPDREMLARSGARPIAMSHHGLVQLRAAGWDNALFAPHMHEIGEEEFAELQAARDEDRERHGLADKFVIGICAANKDQFRKGFFEQLRAFKGFATEHEDAVLLLHTQAQDASGVDLQQLVKDIGIEERVKFTPIYEQLSGQTDPEYMSHWFGTLDLLSNCSYGEGFGVPMLEAQAVGTPVAATRCSAMADLGRAEWLIEGEPFWNYVHESEWTKPGVANIRRAYGKAHRYAATKREMARNAALPYHVDQQRPVWEKLCAELEPSR